MKAISKFPVARDLKLDIIPFENSIYPIPIRNIYRIRKLILLINNSLLMK